MKKISLYSAILININIIIGAGIFLNVKPLTQSIGQFSFASYLLGALILIPFVIVLAKLAQQNPVPGGLYVYSKKHLSPFIGFISGWCYFIGKTVSAAFLAYAFTSFIQTKFLFLQNISTIPLACIVIFLLIALNIAGAHIGGKIQYAFIITKMIPFLFVFALGATKISIASIKLSSLSALLATIPIALYPLMGFEITCSIGHLIKKPNKNIFRAILWSFLIVVTLYAFFQFFVALNIGKILFDSTILTSLIFTSVIAGSFGILSSNCWNLYALGNKGTLTAISKTGVPWISLLVEGGVACLMLAMSQNQVALQSMSVFGVVVSFLLSAIAALRSSKNIISIAAVASCAYILFLCFQKMQLQGVSIPYITILLIGLIFSRCSHQH
jgi:amino acid transporter